MNDIRVSDSGSFALIELLTPRARAWYAKNVEGAPAVSDYSVTIDTAPAERLVKRMVADGLELEPPLDL